MEIKAADVMKLRKMTGAGMMDCKKALVEAEGDYDRAQDIIREKGKLVVSKRADRSASEGVVVTKIVGDKAYILCLACETDFVAQNVEFGASANAILDIAVSGRRSRPRCASGREEREVGSDRREGRAGILCTHRGSFLPRIRPLQQEARYGYRLQQARL